MLTNSELFNCCTDNKAPDWTQYDALTVGGCISVTNGKDESWTEGGIDRNKAEFFTVYGHYRASIPMGVEAITDCKNLPAALDVANALSAMTGLPVNVEC